MWYVVIDILDYIKRRLLSSSPEVAAPEAPKNCYRLLKIYLHIDDNWDSAGQWGSTLVSSSYDELDPPIQVRI